MRRCPACKRAISAGTRKCPLCGYPVPAPLLGHYPAARAVSLIVVVTMALWILWHVRNGLTIEGMGPDDTMISAASPASEG